MTLQELADACVDAINHPERSKPEEPLLTLVGKKGGLFPRKGWPRPKRLLCVNSKEEYVYHYDATNVLAALAARGLVDVSFEERPEKGQGEKVDALR